MQYTTNYNLITVEGTDTVNPLVQMNPNFTDIDSIMKDNADATVARATCIKSGTNHAVTTVNADAAMQRFTATGNWETGDTMTIDSVPVSVYLPDGTAPQTGCFVINTEVVIAIQGTRVTLYAAPSLSQQASDISYDNTGSGLSSTNVQDAIDEIVAMPKGMNALVRVTTDAGITVTVVKGGTTVTATEVSSGVYEAEIGEYGTWTVNSSLGYSRTFDCVGALLYNVSFIPDGRTVTPTDDIQTLLFCAGIFDKPYTVLSQLLADSASLYTVITDNNAIDYLVRSTTFANGVTASSTAMTYIGSDNYASNTLLSNVTWKTAICNSTYFASVLNLKVPTMTSNNTPSGECFGSTANGSDTWYKAFDGIDASGFVSQAASGSGLNIGYDFSSAANIHLCVFSTMPFGTASYDIEESPDGVTWTKLGDVTLTGTGYVYTEGKVIISGDKAKYRINRTTTVDRFYANNVQFYGRVDV